MRQPTSTASSPAPASLPAYCPATPHRRPVAEPVVIEAKQRRRRGENGERMLTVAPLFDGTTNLPMIRMRGAWLGELGFAIGARILVSEERGRLVLTVDQQ